jgi:hypothetical protein
MARLPKTGSGGKPHQGPETRARILKHLLEAEKSTFQEELPFQRSESTTGVQQGKLFVVVMEKIFVCKLNKRKKAA